MEEWQVKVEGIEFVVIGEYKKGEECFISSDPYYDDPGWGSDVEIDQIWVAGSEVDITDVLLDSVIETIIDCIIQLQEDS